MKIELPPLPEPEPGECSHYDEVPPVEDAWYWRGLTKYATAYGRSCYLKALEDAAKAILADAKAKGWAMRSEEPFEEAVAEVVAAAIRALKEG